MKLRHRLLPLLTLVTLGLILYLGQRHNIQWDWSQSGRNQLHPQSQALLQHLDGPLRITAFVPDHPVQRAAIRQLLEKYKERHAATEFVFIDPSQHPEQARKLGIQHTPQLLVQYRGREELVPRANEQLLTSAIARLGLEDRGWILGLRGHGEASLLGQRNFDLGSFGKLLKDKGYRISELNLADTGQIPENVHLLVLASPATSLSGPETELLQNWIQQGGALLWLADGEHPPGLAETLGLDFLPGTVVDAAAAELAIDNPTVAVGRPAPESPLATHLDVPVLMPGARAIRPRADTAWKAHPLLQTGPRSWNETGTLKGSISRDASAGEERGPLTLALALERNRQRVVVSGDGDFPSNSIIGNGANREFALAMVHWLMDNDRLIDIPAFTPVDRQLRWSPARAALIAALFLAGLPLLLAGAGLFITWRRRTR